MNLAEGSVLTDDTSNDSMTKLWFNVTISHACCCSNALPGCRSGYESHIALERDRAQCDAYEAAEFKWIGLFGAVTFVLVLFFERWAAEWCVLRSVPVFLLT